MVGNETDGIETRGRTYLWIGALVFLGALFLLMSASSTSKATLTYDEYVVTGTEIWSTENVVINGSLVVDPGASLTVDGISVLFNNSFDSNLGPVPPGEGVSWLLAYGNLDLIGGSWIASNSSLNYNFRMAPGSTGTWVGSSINQVAGNTEGVRIETDGVTLLFMSISNINGHGIVFAGDSLQIRNSWVSNNFRSGIFVPARSAPVDLTITSTRLDSNGGAGVEFAQIDGTITLDASDTTFCWNNDDGIKIGFVSNGDVDLSLWGDTYACYNNGSGIAVLGGIDGGSAHISLASSGLYGNNLHGVFLPYVLGGEVAVTFTDSFIENNGFSAVHTIAASLTNGYAVNLVNSGIRYNSWSSRMPAIFVEALDGSLTVDLKADSWIAWNYADGVTVGSLQNGDAHLVLTDSYIRGNWGHGASFGVSGPIVTGSVLVDLTRSSIDSNGGWGIWFGQVAQGGFSLSLDQSAIRWNSQGGVYGQQVWQGAIALNLSQSVIDENDGPGVEIYDLIDGSATVVLQQSSSVSYNSNHGVFFASGGIVLNSTVTVLVDQSMMDGNDGSALYVNAIVDGNFQLGVSGSSISWNSGTGVYVDTVQNGAVQVDLLDSWVRWNDGAGLGFNYVEGDVTANIVGGEISWNYWSGFAVGTIYTGDLGLLLDGTSILGNNGPGVYVYDIDFGSMTITLDAAAINWNDGDGFHLASGTLYQGDLMFSALDSWIEGNSGHGVYINGVDGGNATITLMNTTIQSNSYWGVWFGSLWGGGSLDVSVLSGSVIADHGTWIGTFDWYYMAGGIYLGDGGIDGTVNILVDQSTFSGNYRHFVLRNVYDHDVTVTFTASTFEYAVTTGVMLDGFSSWPGLSDFTFTLKGNTFESNGAATWNWWDYNQPWYWGSMHVTLGWFSNFDQSWTIDGNLFRNGMQGAIWQEWSTGHDATYVITGNTFENNDAWGCWSWNWPCYYYPRYPNLMTTFYGSGGTVSYLLDGNTFTDTDIVDAYGIGMNAASQSTLDVTVTANSWDNEYNGFEMINALDNWDGIARSSSVTIANNDFGGSSNGGEGVYIDDGWLMTWDITVTGNSFWDWDTALYLYESNDAPLWADVSWNAFSGNSRAVAIDYASGAPVYASFHDNLYDSNEVAIDLNEPSGADFFVDVWNEAFTQTWDTVLRLGDMSFGDWHVTVADSVATYQSTFLMVSGLGSTAADVADIDLTNVQVLKTWDQAFETSGSGPGRITLDISSSSILEFGTGFGLGWTGTGSVDAWVWDSLVNGQWTAPDLGQTYSMDVLSNDHTESVHFVSTDRTPGANWVFNTASCGGSSFFESLWYLDITVMTGPGYSLPAPNVAVQVTDAQGVLIGTFFTDGSGMVTRTLLPELSVGIRDLGGCSWSTFYLMRTPTLVTASNGLSTAASSVILTSDSSIVINLDGDLDGDGWNDQVDVDADNDGVPNVNDDFPYDPAEWHDNDQDGIGDNADLDDDNDGVNDTEDACPLDQNDYADNDSDTICNNLDEDDDNDGAVDVNDDFPFDPSEWRDLDGDGLGDNVDLDDDNDGVPDVNDVFPDSPAEWADTDADGTGDNADTDDDGDGVADTVDDFPLDATEVNDNDHDGIGDIADQDDDNDGIPDAQDQQPLVANPLPDTDGDGVPDATDLDDDNDGVKDSLDDFPQNPAEWVDTDADGVGDNADWDDDNDGWADQTEIGSGSDPTDPASMPADQDADGIPDALDADIDGDGIPNANDEFPWDPAESRDNDGDGVGNNADTDDDNDGVPDVSDPQPFVFNPLPDADHDGVPDATDADDDNDGVPDVSDPQPFVANPLPDSDGDGVIDAIDADDDNDGVLDTADAFPQNPAESVDTDADGIGDNADWDDDDDGWGDSAEIGAGTDPLSGASQPLDTDGDGIWNAIDPDADNDGWTNEIEVQAGSNPIVATSMPTDEDTDKIADVIDPDLDNDGTLNVNDAYPRDATRTNSNDKVQVDAMSQLLVPLYILVVLGILALLFLVSRRRPPQAEAQPLETFGADELEEVEAPKAPAPQAPTSPPTNPAAGNDIPPPPEHKA